MLNVTVKLQLPPGAKLPAVNVRVELPPEVEKITKEPVPHRFGPVPEITCAPERKAARSSVKLISVIVSVVLGLVRENSKSTVLPGTASAFWKVFVKLGTILIARLS
jgi:hypothetical protein